MAGERVAGVGASFSLRDLVALFDFDRAFEADQVLLRVDRADRDPGAPAMLAPVAWRGFPGAEPQREATGVFAPGRSGVPGEPRKVEREVEGDHPGACLIGERQEDLVDKALAWPHLEPPRRA